MCSPDSGRLAGRESVIEAVPVSTGNETRRIVLITTIGEIRRKVMTAGTMTGQAFLGIRARAASHHVC